jgi:hypothetical protein
LKPHFSRRFAQEVMSVQNERNPISRISWLSTWESQEKWHLGLDRMSNKIKYYKGEGASPKSKPSWVFWVLVCLWFIREPKCFNYALTNLLFGLCKSIWIIYLFIIHLNPHLKVPACSSYPQNVVS